MSTEDLSLIPPHLYQQTYGALYFATVLATAIYGITCMQTFFYFVHYPNDSWKSKTFVATIWALNTVHEALIISGVYKQFISGWEEGPVSLLFGPPDLVLQLVLTVLVAVPAQGYFVHRLYLFSGKNLVGPIIWILSAAIQTAAGLAYVIKAMRNDPQVIEYTALHDYTFMTLASVCLAVGAGVDILIAIFLTFLLIRKQSETTFSSTSHILQRLTVFAVNTGIWPASFNLLTLVLMQLTPLYMVYTVFGIPLCSVYCNTLLANLNARSYVRGEDVVRNADLDLFKTSGSSISNTPKTDRQQGEVLEVAPSRRQGVWKTTEVVRFPETTLSTTSSAVPV